MPKREDIKTILIIGSGPIIIGQACEFDYSGTQACKALKEEGYKIILINSNPATIMTDHAMADKTYIEPITPEVVEDIIKLEKVDAILPTVGGQTALNIAMQLHEREAKRAESEKILNNVQIIGAKIESIKKAEDRKIFGEVVKKCGLKSPPNRVAYNMPEALEALKEIGLPAIIRASFTLGGAGGGIAFNHEEFIHKAEEGLKLSPINEIQIDQSILGWKEFELEVVRDKKDNCIVVCTIENVDPVGVHTGDSITVAPAITLRDNEFQAMRNASIKILREIGVDSGGCNVQFAINPNSEELELYVIEMNPRVSRSSALASKATGYPIARVAAKLAVGFTLDEISNDCAPSIPASFEPTLDYVVIKIPKFNFEKFKIDQPELSISMCAVGEVMAVGRSFTEALNKALLSLDIDITKRGILSLNTEDSMKDTESEALKNKMKKLTPERLFDILKALRYGMKPEEACKITSWDFWFVNQLATILNNKEECVEGVKGLIEEHSKEEMPQEKIDEELDKITLNYDTREVTIKKIEELINEFNALERKKFDANDAQDCTLLDKIIVDYCRLADELHERPNTKIHNQKYEDNIFKKYLNSYLYKDDTLSKEFLNNQKKRIEEQRQNSSTPAEMYALLKKIFNDLSNKITEYLNEEEKKNIAQIKYDAHLKLVLNDPRLKYYIDKLHSLGFSIEQIRNLAGTLTADKFARVKLILFSKLADNLTADEFARVKLDYKKLILYGVFLKLSNKHASKNSVYKRIDTCAAEFPSNTSYLYSTHESPVYNIDGSEKLHCESYPSNSKKKVIIIGSGPNRIGQGIEFDYMCVHACQALKELGYETIMLNCNPETMSTDYDTPDKLYFEPITPEHLLNVVKAESKSGAVAGVISQLGGQTPLNIAKHFLRLQDNYISGKLGISFIKTINGSPKYKKKEEEYKSKNDSFEILGTDMKIIDLVEDRNHFSTIISSTGLKQAASYSIYVRDTISTGAYIPLDAFERIAKGKKYPITADLAFYSWNKQELDLAKKIAAEHGYNLESNTNFADSEYKTTLGDQIYSGYMVSGKLTNEEELRCFYDQINRIHSESFLQISSYDTGPIRGPISGSYIAGIEAQTQQAERFHNAAEILGYPVMIRPSFVIGGQSMAILRNKADLDKYLKQDIMNIHNAGSMSPFLLDKFIEDATEVDVDVICDGKNVCILGIMEHIEQAGIHSGDSSCILPTQNIKDEIITKIKLQSCQLACKLKIKGFLNIQFAIQNSDIYIIEANPRASRTVPFLAKATGAPIVEMAINVIMEKQTIEDLLREVSEDQTDEASIKTSKKSSFARYLQINQDLQKEIPGNPVIAELKPIDYVAVKAVVFPFNKFPNVDVLLGPEMKSTGEVMGVGNNFDIAFTKAQMATNNFPAKLNHALISVKDSDKNKQLLDIASNLLSLGCTILATDGTYKYLNHPDNRPYLLGKNNLPANTKIIDKIKIINKIGEGRPNILDRMIDNDIDFVINTSDGLQNMKTDGNIRRNALTKSIPYTTTIRGANALLSAIKYTIQTGHIPVQPIQKWYTSK